MTVKSRLGIVAGGGDLPQRISDSCHMRGREVFLLAIEGQADPGRLTTPPDAWVKMGQGGKGIKLMRAAGVSEVVFVGNVGRPSMSDLTLDGWSVKFLARIGKALFGDDSFLTAFARALEDEGLTVIGPETVLDGLLAEQRQYGVVAPDDDALADITRAAEVARALGGLDIGQGAIVQQGLVLGVEAAEGTDRLIERCAALRHEGPGGVLVKVSKPGQERRIDLPAIGPETVARAAAAGLRGIAVEAGNALIIDSDDVVRAADAAGIFVVGIAGPR